MSDDSSNLIGFKFSSNVPFAPRECICISKSSDISKMLKSLNENTDFELEMRDITGIEVYTVVFVCDDE